MAADRKPGAFDRAFVRRTLFQAAVIAGLYLLWQLSGFVLVAFGAVVFAVLLRSLAKPLRVHARLNDTLAVLAASLLIAVIVALAAWLFGSLLVAQLDDLAARLPHSPAELEARIRALPMGGQLADWMGGAPTLPPLSGAAGRFGAYAMTAVGAAANLLVILFAGLFLALKPREARDGMLALVPQRGRVHLAEALDASGHALRLWLIGMLADMAATGVMTGLGAWMLGLPSPLALGLLAGLFDFVPIVGPIASAIPGLLVAAPLGLHALGWTAVMYLVVQQAEGNLIYPLIQRRAVQLSPALSILSVAAAGVLFGLLGVILATPLLVVAIAMIKVLYIKARSRETPASDPTRAVG